VEGHQGREGSEVSRCPGDGGIWGEAGDDLQGDVFTKKKVNRVATVKGLTGQSGLSGSRKGRSHYLEAAAKTLKKPISLGQDRRNTSDSMEGRGWPSPEGACGTGRPESIAGGPGGERGGSEGA